TLPRPCAWDWSTASSPTARWSQLWRSSRRRSRAIRAAVSPPPRPSWPTFVPASPATPRKPTPRRCAATPRRGPASPTSWQSGAGADAPMLIAGTRTLGSALEDKAQRFPDRTFLIFEDATGSTARWTWREFDTLVNRVAHLLLARGLRPGDKFNLHLGNCPEFLLFWMAAGRTGTVMVPTNPVSSAEEMAYTLAHSEARLAVTEAQYAAAVHAVAARCPALGGVLEARPLEPLLDGLPAIAPDIALTAPAEVSLAYTSGV